MKSIDVQDLPEPIVRALVSVVTTIRGQLRREQKHAERRQSLPVWPGTVTQPLSREEIYGDVC